MALLERIDSRLTQEEVNERLGKKNIKLVGKYTTSGKKTIFGCYNGHEWETTYASITRSKGCPKCNIIPKLTKEEVNEKIKDRGIQLLEEYTKSQDKLLFKCSNGHEWKAIVSNVIHKTGCPHCDNQFPLSKEIVNERLKDRKIKLIDKFTNVNTKSLFKCSNGHEWMGLPSTIMYGGGCPHCSNRAKLTKEIVNEKIKDRGFELVSDYINTSTKSTFRCSEGHEWVNFPWRILGKEKGGCLTCSNKSGLGGIKVNKPIHGYLLDFGTFIKFGISSVLHNRLRRHKKNGEYTVIETKYFENGQDALNWETAVKRKFGGSYVGKEVCPDGYTETLPISLRDELIESLRIYENVL